VFSDMREAKFRHNFKPKELNAVVVDHAPFVSEGTMIEGNVISVKDLVTMKKSVFCVFYFCRFRILFPQVVMFLSRK